MSELALFLKRQMQDRNWTWRVAEETIGISKTALANMIENPTAVPTLDSLVKISRAFQLPLWRVVEMCGFDLEIGTGPNAQAQRLADLMEALPEYRPVVEYLTQIDPTDLEGVLMYLETLQRRRNSQTKM